MFMADRTSPPLAYGLISLLGSGQGPCSRPGSALMSWAPQPLNVDSISQVSPEATGNNFPLFSAGESSSFLDKYPLRFSLVISLCAFVNRRKRDPSIQCQGTLLHSGGLPTHTFPSYLTTLQMCGFIIRDVQSLSLTAHRGTFKSKTLSLFFLI